MTLIFKPEVDCTFIELNNYKFVLLKANIKQLVKLV